MNKLQARFAIVTCVVLLGLAGCGSAGPAKHSVQGRVSFDGKPIEQGVISFLPGEGVKGPMAGGTITNGTFEITTAQGPVAGQHRVSITAERKTGEKIAAVPPATGEIEVTEQYIPEKYNTKTELTVEIKPGANQFEWDLKP